MKKLFRRCVHAVFGPPVKKDPDSPAVRWRILYETAFELAPKDTCAAEAPSREALEIAEKSFGIGNWRIFDSMKLRLRILCFSGKVNESEELCDRLIEVTKHYYGDDSEETVELLVWLPVLFQNNNNLEKADKLYRETIPIMKKRYGQDARRWAHMMAGFARVSSSLGRLDAEQWALRRLLAHAKRRKLQKMELQIEIMLATSFARENSYDMAEGLARTLPEEVKLPCDRDDYGFVKEIPRLADACLHSGRYEQAEDLYELYIRMVKSYNKNKDLPDIIPGLKGLALLYFKTGMPGETENLLRRIHGIIKTAFLSTESGSNYFSDDDLLQFLDQRGRQDESEALLLDVAEKCEDRFGRNSIRMYTLLYDIGWLYLRHDKLDEAGSCFSEALGTASEYCRPESPYIIYTLAGIGKVHLGKSRFPEAASYLLKAIERYDDSELREEGFLADLLHDLGKAALAVGNYSNAELYFSRQVAVLENLMSPEDPALIVALGGLGRTLHLMKLYSEGEEVYKRLLKIQRVDESNPGQKNFEVAMTLKMLSDDLVEQKKYMEAEKLYFQAMDLLKMANDEESLWIGRCLEGIARIRGESGYIREGEGYLKRAMMIYEKTGLLDEDHMNQLKEVLAHLEIILRGAPCGSEDDGSDDNDKSIN